MVQSVMLNVFFLNSICKAVSPSSNLTENPIFLVKVIRALSTYKLGSTPNVKRHTK